MPETCAWCGRSIGPGDREQGRVHTEDGLLCGECTAKYFAGLRESRPAKPQAGSGASPEEPAREGDSEAGEPGADAGPRPEEEPEEEPDERDPFAMLEEIRREVSEIRQSIVFDKVSLWNTLGAIAQALAVGALVAAVAHWTGGPTDLLLVGVLLQTMALACFVRGK
jgi:hypothetical protein